jgi:hypothetical protein
MEILQFLVYRCALLAYKTFLIKLKRKAKTRGVTTKFPEWFYCTLTYTLTAYWGGTPSKYFPWAAVPFAQWCYRCWEHLWFSCCGIASSACVIFLWTPTVSWNLSPIKADFIFGNSQKSFGGYSEFSITALKFRARNWLLDRECLVSWGTVVVGNPVAGPSSAHVPCTTSRNRFSIST